jgi:triosephosphate isomerase
MKFIIANWKMNLNVEQSIALTKDYLKYFKKTPAEVVVCPSFTSLPFVGKMLDDSPLAVGAQDVFWEKSGAFTGEVSALDLVALKAGYVIIGHSERRQHLGEEDWMMWHSLRLKVLILD